MKLLDKIFKFNGGIQAETKKEVSTRSSIKFLPIPSELRLPLRQHIGNIAKLKVKVGDHVLKGQLIAEADGNISAAIHAPTSGKIRSVEKLLIPHPRLHKRNFVLFPLFEIDKNWKHPLKKKKNHDLIGKLDKTALYSIKQI